MRTINPPDLRMVVAVSAVIGAALGFWSSGSPGATAARSGAQAARYCGDGSWCESMTWLRMPVMRRTAGNQ